MKYLTKGKNAQLSNALAFGPPQNEEPLFVVNLPEIILISILS